MDKKRLVLLFVVLGVCFPVFSKSIFLEKSSNFKSYISLTSSKGITLYIKYNKRIRIYKKDVALHVKPEYVHDVFVKTPRYGNSQTLDFSVLHDDLKKTIIEKLYPDNSFSEGYYRHHVTYGGVESFWRIAEWYTGNGVNYKSIMRTNNIRNRTLFKNAVLKIPESMLIDIFKPVKQPEPIIPLDNEVTIQQNSDLLTYSKDSKGEYAVYKLKKGEALYSSVVVRFTGRLDADSVLELADEIAERSDIKDVTDIAVGYPVKIPYEYLLPEYLPVDSAQYKEYREELNAAKEAADTEKITQSDKLNGIYIILDAGHGGRDPGAVYNGAWEDDYVYDIMCRVKRIIETETEGTVITTIYDKSNKYNVSDSSSFKRDSDEYLRTTPLFSLNSSTVTSAGVNLRWYISNYHTQRLIKSGVPRTNIVFASFHADALYRKVSGAMVYIPYSKIYSSKASYTKNNVKKYHEVKSNPVYHFTRQEVQLAEGLSRKFSNIFLNELKNQGCTIHDEKPIRECVYRSRRSRPFVPAVIKYNKPMVRTLIEVVNLKNKKDAKRLKQSSYREKFARAYVNALLKFYS